MRARACRAKLAEDATLPATLRWRIRAGKQDVEVGWVPARKRRARPGSRRRCSRASRPASRMCRSSARRTCEDEEESSTQSDAMGVARFSASPLRGRGRESRPQATTRLGYELRVSARVEGTGHGLDEAVPLAHAAPRAAPARHAGAGARRGRGAGGAAARPRLQRPAAGEALAAGRRDPAGVQGGSQGPRWRSFRLPADFEGWAEVQWGTAIARVYVAPRAQLAVEVAPEKPAYAPGEVARLLLHTRVDGKEGPAAVGLFGVDEGLAQLAPLPGPDGAREPEALADADQPRLRGAGWTGARHGAHPGRERGGGGPAARQLGADRRRTRSRRWR